MSKRFLLILVGFVVLFGGLLVFNKRNADAPTDTGGDTATLSEHVVGKGTSGVTLTEYGDFACPACYQFYPVVKQIKEKYGDQIKFQFRHFPLTEIHQNALIAARAAEAAGLQGKFFEMHDKLYESQPDWAESKNPAQFFEDYAQQLSLDVEKFKNDSKGEATNATVQADRAHAREQGYSSTPTFLIDGKKIENPQTPDAFYKLIDDAIAAKKNG